MSAVQNLKEKIIQKAWEDDAFKKQLLSNPKSAIQDSFGINVPDSIQLEVLEEAADKFYLVLPQSPIELKAKATVQAMWT